MSAICGAVGLDGRPFVGADLRGVLETLTPLGPDGGGEWSGVVGRCGVAVAARLRRRTPHDAVDRQPLVTADGALVVVADVRIDNRAELSCQLGLADRPDRPDSAFVAAAYQRWGTECPTHLVGVGAMAIVDRRRAGVLLVRDHLGERPLVVHQRPGVVAFASNALALTAFDGVGHALDAQRARDVLALTYSSERTFVDGVRWLLPGHAAWIDAGGLRQWRWWCPDPDRTVDLGSNDAHAEALRGALDVAVASQLRTTGRVGVMVSGGLDSPSVAATLARHLTPEPLRTYTSVPPPGWAGETAPSWEADESHLVRDLAAMHPTIHPTFIDVRGAALFEDREEQYWALGATPTRNPCNMLWIGALHEEAAADGVGALFTGGRGNAAFSADGPQWLVALWRAGRIPTLLRELVSWPRHTGATRWSTVSRSLLAELTPDVLRRSRSTFLHRPDPLDSWVGATALRSELASTVDLLGAHPQLGGSRHVSLRHAMLAALGTSGGQADGRAAMEAVWGLDTRDPTADRRLFELAMTQPEWARRHDGTTRAVARRAMADRLPPSILHRTNRGAQLPDWLDRLTDRRDELVDELATARDHPASQELIDFPRLDRLMQVWPDSSRSADRVAVRDYRLAMFRALHVSRYLRWFERRAAAAA